MQTPITTCVTFDCRKWEIYLHVFYNFMILYDLDPNKYLYMLYIFIYAITGGTEYRGQSECSVPQEHESVWQKCKNHPSPPGDSV